MANARRGPNRPWPLDETIHEALKHTANLALVLGWHTQIGDVAEAIRTPTKQALLAKTMQALANLRVQTEPQR